MYRERRPIDISALASAFERADPDGEITLLNERRSWARSKGEEIKEDENREVVIKEITYGDESYDKDGVRRMRVTKDRFYGYLEIGLRYKDNPDEFSVQRFLTFNMEELPKIKELLELIEE